MPRAALAGALVLLVTLLCSCGGGTSEASGSTAPFIVETEDQGFVEWTRQTASTIESLDSSDELAGLDGLSEIVGDARIIAVGEPVYGTSEISRVKRRMFEYLVRHRDVRTVVAEVGWSEALAIDEYVRTGSGNPEELLTRVRTWTWNTSEALDFIRWMRSYNATVPAARQLHFFGADMLYTAASAFALRAYLQEVDPEFLTRVDDSLMFYSDPEKDEKYERIRSREGGSLQFDVERALDRLWRKRRQYAERTSQARWAIAEHHGQVLRQAIEIWRAPLRAANPSLLRERYLAENVRWILDQEDTGGKVFLWSHNSHVSVEALQDGERMGRQLQRMFGSDLVVIGVLFNKGTFRATTGGRDVVEVEIGPAPRGSVEHTMSKVGPKAFIVDLRRASDLVDEWLQAKCLTRETGVRFSDPNSMTRTCILGRRFDALVWVDTTTASSLTSAWIESPSSSDRDAG